MKLKDLVTDWPPTEWTRGPLTWDEDPGLLKLTSVSEPGASPATSSNVPAAPGSNRADLAFARGQLAALPAREREAFVLVEIEELTSVEAAGAMGISDSTVRVLLSRARNRLQEGAAAAPRRTLKVEGRRP